MTVPSDEVRFEFQRRVAESEDIAMAEVIVSGHGRQSGADFHNRLFHLSLPFREGFTLPPIRVLVGAEAMQSSLRVRR